GQAAAHLQALPAGPVEQLDQLPDDLGAAERGLVCGGLLAGVLRGADAWARGVVGRGGGGHAVERGVGLVEGAAAAAAGGAAADAGGGRLANHHGVISLRCRGSWLTRSPHQPRPRRGGMVGNPDGQASLATGSYTPRRF